MYGERIRQLRKESNMTLRDLSEELDIPFTTLGNYEREDRNPSIDTLQKIARFFNTSVDYLTGSSNDRTKEEYIFNKGNELVLEMLQNASREEKKLISETYRLMFTLMSDAKGYEVKNIHEIIRSLARIKENNEVWEPNPNFNPAETLLEYTVFYHNEKSSINNNMDRLYELYAEKLEESLEE